MEPSRYQRSPKSTKIRGLRCRIGIARFRCYHAAMHAPILRYFDEVARCGSIRRAAETLNVASSAVNRQILKLERDIGTRLFERHRAGVKLTTAGEVLLRHSRETMSSFDRACSEIAGLNGVVSGNVRVIALESLTVRFMPQAVHALITAHPALSMTVVVVDPSEIGEELRSGRNDFGVLFVDGRISGVKVISSFQTAIGAVMRPDHPLARRRRVTLTECAAFPVMMLHDRWLLDAIMATEFAKSGARLAPRVVSNSIEFMRQTILSDLGIGFFTPIGFADEIRSGELVHVPLAEPGLDDSRIGIIVPSARPLSAPAKIVVDTMASRLDAFAKALPRQRSKK